MTRLHKLTGLVVYACLGWASQYAGGDHAHYQRFSDVAEAIENVRIYRESISALRMPWRADKEREQRTGRKGTFCDRCSEDANESSAVGS